MNVNYSFKTAIKGLRTNGSRSALTILGIVIGITAIMMVMSLGQGAQNLILTQIQSMGSKVIEIRPGREPKGLSDFLQMFSDSLKEKDLIKALREYGVRLSDIKKVLSYINFLDIEYKNFINSLPTYKALSIEEVRKITKNIGSMQIDE